MKANFQELQHALNSKPWAIGSDECGLGSWAGPMVLAAVKAPKGWQPPLGLNDSKQLSQDRRVSLATILKASSELQIAVRIISAEEIDERGLGECCRTAHKSLHHELRLKLSPSDVVSVVDGDMALGKHIYSLPKADSLVPVVSAASVIAKVEQIRLMHELDVLYPQYDFKRCAGYGTPNHKEAIAKHGVCPAHRKSYTPIARVIAQQDGLAKFMAEVLDELPQE